MLALLNNNTRTQYLIDLYTGRCRDKKGLTVDFQELDNGEVHVFTDGKFRAVFRDAFSLKEALALLAES